jgi:alkyldihydroxyacetonephosphate synthase
MSGRLKFYGWGIENTGLDKDERDRLFRFLFDRLGVEPRPVAAPRLEDINLRPPRVTAPATIAGAFTEDPYERLLHTYGKSYPETVCAFSRDFANAPDLVAIPQCEADVSAILDWAGGANVAIIPFGCGSSVVGGVQPIVGTGTPASSASICVGLIALWRSTRSAVPRASKRVFGARPSRPR